MNTIKNAVLLIDQQSQWASAYAGRYKNLHVHTLAFEPLLQGDSVDQGLRQWAVSLLHYDLALVAVSPANLSWIRSQLYYARRHLRTPILAIVRNLQAIAIQDVLDAGADDFLHADSLKTELPIRVKLLQQRLHKNNRYHPQPETSTEVPNVNDEELLLNESSAPLDAYTAAVAARYAAHGQPFQQAKNTVVQRFEKAYIRATLVRNQGNITRAARAANKHRRSFWELMRKHNIDADIYRVSACPDSHQFVKISRY